MADAPLADDAPIVATRQDNTPASGDAPVRPISDPNMDAHNAAVKQIADETANPRSGWDTLNDAWSTQIGPSMLAASTRAKFEPDPTYDKTAFQRDFDAMVKTGQIDQQVLADSIGAPVSNADFNARAHEIFDHQNTLQRLSKDGFWPSLGANVIAGMADPATIALGMGTGAFLKAGAVSAGVSRAALASRSGVVALGLTDAALQGVGATAIHSQTDLVQPDLHEYLMAAGTGLVMHGVVHGITEHALPAATRVGKGMLQSANEMRTPKTGGEISMRPIGVEPVKAQEGTSWHPDAPDAEFLKAPGRPPEVAEPRVADQAVDAVKAHTDAIPGVAETAEGLRPHANAISEAFGIDKPAAQPFERTRMNDVEDFAMTRGGAVKPSELQERFGINEATAQAAHDHLVEHEFAKPIEGRDYAAAKAELQERLSAAGSHTDLMKVAQAAAPGPHDPDSSAGAAMVPGSYARLHPHDFNVSEPAIMADNDVAYSFAAHVRPGIGAYLGRHANALVRLWGAGVHNDQTGKVGHALNGQAVELNGIRLKQRLSYAYHSKAEEAFQAYNKAAGGPQFMQGTARNDFHNAVTRELAGMKKVGEPAAHPEVVKAAEAARQVYKTYAELHANPLAHSGGTARPIGDGGLLQHDPNYSPREYAHRKMMDAFDSLGAPRVKELFKGAILAKQSHLSDQTAGHIADGMINGIMDRTTGNKNGIHDNTGGRDFGDAFANGDREAMARYLRRSGVADADVNQIMGDLFRQHGGDGGVSTNTKNRVLLDHNYSIKDAKGNDVYFHDLLEHNQSKLLSRYGDRNAGRIALGQLQLRNPTTGEMLINGITRDSEFSRFMEDVNKSNSELVSRGKLSAAAAGDTQAHLQFSYDRIVGRPMDHASSFAKQAMNLIRATNISKMVNAGMFAHATEGVMSMSQSGIKAWMQHNPTMHMLFGDSMSMKAIKDFHDELHGLGYGIDHAHGMHDYDSHTGARDYDAPPVTLAERAMHNAASKFDTVNEHIMNASQLPRFLDRQQTMAAAGIAQRFYDMAAKMQSGTKVPQGWTNRLAHMNIDPQMHERIGDQLMKFAGTQDGLFGRKLNKLNMDSWTDHEARAALDSGIFRMSRKMVQSRDSSLMGMYVSHPFASLLLQFKSFVLQAWSNHTLYAVHNMDAHMLAGILGSTVMAGMMYAAHTLLSHGGYTDDAKKALTVENIGRAAFQRAGWSSVIPNIIDTQRTAFSQPPWFDNRASGSSSGFFSPPAFTNAQHIVAGIEAGTHSIVTGQKMSQEGIKNLLGVIPGSSFAPIQGLISHMIKDRPKYDQKAPTAHSSGTPISAIWDKLSGH